MIVKYWLKSKDIEKLGETGGDWKRPTKAERN
jgi:hypothetical protein